MWQPDARSAGRIQGVGDPFAPPPVNPQISSQAPVRFNQELGPRPEIADHWEIDHAELPPQEIAYEAPPPYEIVYEAPPQEIAYEAPPPHHHNAHHHHEKHHHGNQGPRGV
jgi:hypothetical protein